MSRNITFIILIAFVASCSSIPNHPVFEIIDKDIPESGKKVFMIIPIFVGCHTCIEESLAFFQERQNNSDLIAVLAYADQQSNSSMKEKILSMGINLNYGDNVVLDSTNKSFKNELITMNPTVYFYHDGNLSLLELKPSTILGGFEYIDEFVGGKD